MFRFAYWARLSRLPFLVVALISFLVAGCGSSGTRSPDLSQSPDNLTAIARIKAQPTAGEPALRPDAEPSFFPTSTPTPIPSLWMVGNTGGDGVYIRRTSSASDKIKAWPERTLMFPVGEDKESEGRVWKNVKDPDGNEGWVPAEYLVLPTPTPLPTGTPWPTPTVDRSRFKLELLAARGTSQYGFATVEGQVKNMSGASLKNVEVLVEWYTAEGTFVKSDSALIEYNPILPGQTSPFKSITTDNPAMKRFTVKFKGLMGGAIPVLDSRK